jgi:uncharacterized surface protein with fasciclin (FAS1) repeats
VSTRTKTLGVVAAIAAIAVAVPTAVNAYADPAPVDPAAPTTAAPAPTSTKVPDPQGPGCGAYRSQVPSGAGSIASMAVQTASQAIASNPDLSTFSAAISGKLNPDINIVSVLDGGPYIVFAPTDAAFSKLDPATVATLKTDPTVLLPVLFYHMVLGNVGPANVAGKMPTQDGRPLVVTGKDGDIKVNDNRVSCAYAVRGGYVYMIDTVLTPPTPAAESPAAASGTETPSSEAPSSAAPTTSAAPASESAAPTTSAASASESAAPTTSAAPASATEAAPSTTAAAPSTEAAPTTTAKPAA